MATKEKAYLVAWPIFGTSNQLLASLTLLALSVWLISRGKPVLYTILPMLFMLVMTLWSLITFIIPFIQAIPVIFSGTAVKPDIIIAGICGIILLVLSVLLMYEAAKVLLFRRADQKI